MIISADDFGLSPAVSRGILELIEHKRIQATSVMLIYPDAESSLKELLEYSGSIDIGLHLVVSDLASENYKNGIPITVPFWRLWLKAHFGKLNAKQVREQILDQICAFQKQLGRDPDFIDGHQHVHQLPLVREMLIDVIQELKLGPYVRVTQGPSLRSFSMAIFRSKGSLSTRDILKTGASLAALTFACRGLQKLCKKYRIRHNKVLLGHYDYSRGGLFSAYWGFYLEMASCIPVENQNQIYLCHPGHQDSELRSRDNVQDSREECWRFLMSEKFSSSLRAKGISVNQFK